MGSLGAGCFLTFGRGRGFVLGADVTELVDIGLSMFIGCMLVAPTAKDEISEGARMEVKLGV